MLKISEMTPKEKRIAIAEACGIKPPYKIEQGENPKDWVPRKTIWTIPSYLEDLNAMHEAEKALFTGPASKGKRRAYFELLARIAGDSWHATAAQRAEAFLRTLGIAQ